MFGRHRSVHALGAAAFLAASVAGLAAAESPPAWESTSQLRPVAGEVTITAPAGLSGIRFDTTGDRYRLDMRGATVDAFEGEIALIQGIWPGDGGYFDEPRGMNGPYMLAAIPGFYTEHPTGQETQPSVGCEEDSGDPTVPSNIPCVLPYDTLEWYIAADAPVTFTIHFLDRDLKPLPGTAAYQADGHVDGYLEEIPTTACPTGDCSDLEIGHVVHSVGSDEAFGSVFGFAYANHSTENLDDGVGANATGVQGVMGCSYPSFFVPYGSPDPADHPLGCDVTPTVDTERDDVYWDSRVVDTYTRTPPFTQATGMYFGHRLVNGEAYAGFNIRNRQLLPGYPGTQNAWAVWLEPGMH